MSLTTDIFTIWRHPSATLRSKLAEGKREDRALVLILTVCMLFFVARWPTLSRQAHLDQQQALAAGTPLDQIPSLQALMGINLFVMLFMVPLVFYFIAAVSALVMRVFKSKITHYGARLALFWALLAISPLVLLQGMVAGFMGQGNEFIALGVITAIAFLGIWIKLLREAAR